MDEPRGSTRREVIRDGSALAIAVLAAAPGGALGSVAVPVRRDARAFLSTGELTTLRALVDRVLPGERDGAVAAGAAEAIDALLGAFRTDPPRIYAGGPFSDRAGSPRNDFARFERLDAYEEKAWRLRIEGSRGRRELEFNGPVVGWQAIYRRGLKALGGTFAGQPAERRDALLEQGAGQAPIAALLDVAVPHTLQLTYGAPEYGGNRRLVGWRSTGWPGDVQPRGWSRAEVERPPARARAAATAAPIDERLLRIGALAGSPEAVHTALTQSDGSLAGLRHALGFGQQEAGHGA